MRPIIYAQHKMRRFIMCLRCSTIAEGDTFRYVSLPLGPFSYVCAILISKYKKITITICIDPETPTGKCLDSSLKTSTS